MELFDTFGNTGWNVVPSTIWIINSEIFSFCCDCEFVVRKTSGIVCFNYESLTDTSRKHSFGKKGLSSSFSLCCHLLYEIMYAAFAS